MRSSFLVIQIQNVQKVAQANTFEKKTEITTDKGKKFDGDKLRTDLLPVSALTELAKVLGFGAKKYGDHNWKAGIDYNRLYGATLRHLLAWWDGEDNDTESKLSHLSHAMCNIAFLIEYQSNKKWFSKFDNRPGKGGK